MAVVGKRAPAGYSIHVSDEEMRALEWALDDWIEAVEDEVHETGRHVELADWQLMQRLLGLLREAKDASADSVRLRAPS